MMQALADQNIADLAETFGRHLDLRLVPGRALARDDLGDAEVLLVRSVTRVDEGLLEGSAVRFVGTATIGTDHLDTDWLDAAGITWASAPGCNADAAAQYTLAMMLLACRRLDRELAGQKVAIVGHGNVGSRLHRLLGALGVPVIVCDPPLVEAGALAGVPLAQALEADIVSLHVPLERGGAWPTIGMIDEAALSRMRRGALLVNAARGAVVDGNALLVALRRGHVHAALDVWPEEPVVDRELLAATVVASPHVAGYSVEGKAQGTRMIYQAFLAWSGEVPPPAIDASVESTPAQPQELRLPPDRDDAVIEAVLRCTRIERDDQRMRALGSIDAAAFDALRRGHAPRHEFGQVRVSAPTKATPVLSALGFHAAPTSARP